MKAKWAYFVVLLGVAFVAHAQAPLLDFERGVPEECRRCGPCSAAGEGICVCFKKIVFQDADVRAVLALLADTAGINIVTDPDLSVKVSLKLENISWCQIFSLILDLYSLRALQKEGYIYVLSDAKYWTLKFDEMGNITKEMQMKLTETRTFRLTNTEVDDIEPIVKTMLSASGNLSKDPPTNTLIITDIPDQFEQIAAIIESLDVSVQQLRITIQMVQIDKSEASELGINFSFIDDAGDISGGSSLDRVADRVGTATWNVVAGKFDFQTRLSAIISSGRGTLLDVKTCVVKNHMPCALFSGRKIAYNSLDQAGNLLQTWIEVGNKLDVTPHIICNRKVLACDGIQESGNEIQMSIYFERSGYTPGAGTQYDITTRYVRTDVTVDDGDVLAIGNVVTNEYQYNVTAVPILSKIPLLGELFKYRNKSVKTAVITIFVTPEIMPP